MSISESRANSRGPLIAVIKIEIYEDQVDRIFLHQNDDDYRLAEDFQHKHGLNPLFVGHIYEKIKASRESLQKEASANSILMNTHRSNNQSHLIATPNQNEKQKENTYRNTNDNYPTPYDRITRFTPIQEEPYHANYQEKELQKANFSINAKSIFHEQPEELFQEENSSKNATLQDTQTFHTNGLMKTGNIHNSHNLFDSFLREKKNASTRRQNEKTGPQVSCHFESQEIVCNEPSSYIANANLTVPHYSIKEIERNKHSSSSNYSFNEDKPSRVKVLNKDQMESMRSSKQSLNKFEKEKIAKQVTSRLYNETDIKKNYLNRIKERAKQEKQEEEDKELTHRPQINKTSQILAADRYRNMSIQDHLHEQAKHSELKKEAERMLMAEKELENCSFKPEVNIISKQLVRSNSKSFLKEERKSLQSCSRKHSQSQTGFRPSLNKMSEQIVKSKAQGNFEQRLKGFLELKNSKLSDLTREKNMREKIDQSGQELYRPRINSKPSNRSPKGSQVYDYLYELSKVDKQIPVLSQKPTINENSELIIQQMQAKRINWLFSELDSDQDGYISSKKISINSLDEALLEVISPVLFEMEEVEAQLNLNEFKNTIRRFHTTLNAHQKSILYNYNNKTQEIQSN